MNSSERNFWKAAALVAAFGLGLWIANVARASDQGDEAFDTYHNATKQQLCQMWARDAMYGMASYARGKKRDVRPVTDEEIRNLVASGKQPEYMIEFAFITEHPEVQEFVEGAIYFGYDTAKAMGIDSGDKLPNPNEAFKAFVAECLKRDQS